MAIEVTREKVQQGRQGREARGRETGEGGKRKSSQRNVKHGKELLEVTLEAILQQLAQHAVPRELSAANG